MATLFVIALLLAIPGGMALAYRRNQIAQRNAVTTTWRDLEADLMRKIESDEFTLKTFCLLLPRWRVADRECEKVVGVAPKPSLEIMATRHLRKIRRYR